MATQPRLQSLGNEIVSKCGAILCDAACLLRLSEVGTFPAADPGPEGCGVDAAMSVSPEALGLASWALTPLYVAAKARMGASRSDYHAATAMLVATPDFATAWAVRREHLPHGTRRGSAVLEELHFCSLILRRSPKSVETWTHRMWVLQRYGWGDPPDISRELEVALKAASTASCNYYAGVHRSRALQLANAETVVKEVDRSRQWLETHVSDCSGWWYHTLVVRRAVPSLWGRGRVSEEISFASKMAQSYGAKYESVRKYNKWWEQFINEQGLKSGLGSPKESRPTTLSI